MGMSTKKKACEPDEKFADGSQGSRREFLKKPLTAGAIACTCATSVWATDLPAPGTRIALSGTAFNVRDFGAAGDGKALNTRAIQAAIDRCHAAGGGCVLVPPGVYVTGTVRLKSHVTLRLEAGARLLGSPRIADYPKDAGQSSWHPRFPFSRGMDGALIYAEQAEDVGVEGPGIIDGAQGGGAQRTFPNANDRDQRRPMLVRMHDCTGVRVRNVTLIHPASFTSFFVRCREVYLDSVKVRSRDTGNGDGLDFDGSENVRISNCDLDTGDDAIGLKTIQPGRPNRDFVITNCIIRSRWAAVRLGPESFADMRNLTVSNCVFRDCRDGLKIQSCEGAVLENMVFSDIVMEAVLRPFFLVLNSFGMSKYSRSVRPPVGALRDLHFAHIRAVVPQNPTGEGLDQPCLAIVGLPGYPIEDISISNLNASMPGGGTKEEAARMDVPELYDFQELWPEAVHFKGELPASGIYLRHVRGLRVDQVRLSVANSDARAFIAGDDLEDVSLSDVVGYGSAAAPGLVKLADARDVNLRNCHVRVLGQQADPGIHAGDPRTDRPLVVALTPAEEARLARLRGALPSQQAKLEQEATLMDAAWAATLAVLPTVWKFRPDPNDEGESGHWFAEPPGAGWSDTRIDQPWVGQSRERSFGGWISVGVNVPAFPTGRRVFLYLGTIAGPCQVWLDGQAVEPQQRHAELLGRKPFAVELTSILRTAGTHRLTLRVGGEAARQGIGGPLELRLGN